MGSLQENPLAMKLLDNRLYMMIGNKISFKIRMKQKYPAMKSLLVNPYLKETGAASNKNIVLHLVVGHTFFVAINSFILVM